jgi:hypothetical protein
MPRSLPTHFGYIALGRPGSLDIALSGQSAGTKMRIR